MFPAECPLTDDQQQLPSLACAGDGTDGDYLLSEPAATRLVRVA